MRPVRRWFGLKSSLGGILNESWPMNGKPGQHLVYASSDLSRLDILGFSRNSLLIFNGLKIS